MADFNKTTAERNIAFSGSYGNAAVGLADFASIGVMVGADVFYAAKIARSSVINDLSINLEAAISAGAFKVGYIMDGVTVDDYFLAAAAAGAKTRSSAMPLECTDDCYIIVTPAAATVADLRMAIATAFEYKGDV